MLLRTRHETANDRMKAHTRQAIRDTMLFVVGKTPVLLEVVAGGPQKWRSGFLRESRGLAIDGAICDRMFAFFAQTVQRQFGHVPPAALMDALEVNVVKPPTQREIDDSWECESASSDEGRRYFYGRDGHPEQIVKQVMVS